ncbi:MAG: hypothetical protein K0M58_02765 [Thiobacillus sp.]|nr:hypothetical protein [Thiobacillus sp.]
MLANDHFHETYNEVGGRKFQKKETPATGAPWQPVGIEGNRPNPPGRFLFRRFLGQSNDDCPAKPSK